MKVIIFSKGKGWYISCSNYKDDKDKAYINLFFPKASAPSYKDNGQGFSVKAIEIEEGKFTSFKSKPGLTVFKYREVEIQQKKEQPQEDISKFGGSRADSGKDIGIEPDDLPFY